MKHRNLFRPAGMVLFVLALTVLLVPSLASAQATGIEGEIAAVEARLLNSQAANLSLIAPKSFAEAKDKLAEAKQKYAKGGKIEDIQSKLKEVTQKLDTAGQVQSVGNLLLKDSLIARADALEANAPEFAAKLWESANDAMYKAGREVEKGDQNKARDQSAEAVERYRIAELEAIRANLLGGAHAARDEAVAAKASEKAPLTFKEGETLLAGAEKTLRGDRYQRTEAKNQALHAINTFRHATYLSGLVDKVGDKKNWTVEQMVLSHEDALAQAALELNIEPDFSRGVEPVSESVVSALSSLKTDRMNLQSDIQDRDERLKLAAAQIDSMNASLADNEERGRMTSAVLERNNQRQADLENVHRMFLDSEAVVLLDGKGLIIRMHGLTFPIGSSEILPANFELLTKLQRVLRIYPLAPVTIDGHTDAQGDTDYNQALSQRRAEAVRSYLLANMGSAADNYLAIGFGESKPIASNETAEGRTQNRRIDVNIDLSGS